MEIPSLWKLRAAALAAGEVQLCPFLVPPPVLQPRL